MQIRKAVDLIRIYLKSSSTFEEEDTFNMHYINIHRRLGDNKFNSKQKNKVQKHISS